MNSADEAVAAIRAGELVVIPTDTVYGLACTLYRETSVRALSALKGRAPDQPIALVATNLDYLIELVPELRGRAAAIAQALLPGPFTLVFPNPARRFPWLTSGRADTIGVRVPDVSGAAREFLGRVGAVAATSANRHGSPDPSNLDEVPQEILAGVAAALDGGQLQGTPSTVLDLTGPGARVLREGAVPSADALARVRAALDE